MQLRPVLASYSGESYAAMRRYLTDAVLEIIASVARSPRHREEISPDVLAELVEMHVFRERGDQVVLETSVFFQEDIERIVDTVKPLAQELSGRILACGSGFRDTAPEVTLFLGGIIGVVQGPGASLKQNKIGVEWWNYPGRYGRAKADFDELCEAYDALGPDLLNKTVLQGERYIAVFIGPGGDNLESLIYDPCLSERGRQYAAALNHYLPDLYAGLVKGEVESRSLHKAAEMAGLYDHGRSRTAVISSEMVERYEPAIRAIIETASAFYEDRLDQLDSLLRSTTPGRQGVPLANMALNLWRYIRKLTARELYAAGFFTDDLPARGTITVFYEHDIPLLKQLLL